MSVGLLATGYSGAINPTDYKYLSLIGFSFPLFLIATVAFLLLWVIVKWKYAFVPVLSMILAYSPIMTYLPLNFSSNGFDENLDTKGDDVLKVLSFNILGYNLEEAPEGVPNPILEYLINSDADVICVQEYARHGSLDSLYCILEDKYQHSDTIHSDGYEKGSDIVGIYSRFPILHKEHIPIYTRGNSLGVFDLMINGDTVHVINAHLETVGMSMEQKAQFSEIVHGKQDRSDVKSGSKLIVQKLANSAAVRAPQADAISEYIHRHNGERILFCGDINDHPLSYVHNVIARPLTDCYREAGFWVGYSFQYNSMYVRIDNIMCSEHYEPLFCKVDKSVNLSDHFPVYCYLRTKKRTE